MTQSKIEQLEAQRRQSQARNSDLLNYISDGQKQAHAANNELKVKEARRGNVLARVAAENMVAEKVEQSEKDARMKALINEQNSRLATEISLRNAEEERMEREIQRMCETSEELKELERKLNIAYVNKERAAQHQEAVLLNKLEVAREAAIEDQMEYERQLFIKKEMDKETERRNGMMEQKHVIQKQILDRQVLAVEAREEAARDKELVDAIVMKIEQEDRMDIEERNQKKEETRALVKFYSEERERRKAQLWEEQKAQEAEIRAYNDLMAERLRKETEEKKAAEEEKKKRWAAVVEQTKQQTQSKDEFNLLRDMLWEEELEAQRIKQDKERAIKRAKDKEDMMRENQKQLDSKKKMIAEMEQEEVSDDRGGGYFDRGGRDFDCGGRDFDRVKRGFLGLIFDSPLLSLYHRIDLSRLCSTSSRQTRTRSWPSNKGYRTRKTTISKTSRVRRKRGRPSTREKRPRSSPRGTTGPKWRSTGCASSRRPERGCSRSTPRSSRGSCPRGPSSTTRRPPSSPGPGTSETTQAGITHLFRPLMDIPISTSTRLWPDRMTMKTMTMKLMTMMQMTMKTMTMKPMTVK